MSARDDAVTTDQWSASPPSSSALCGHPCHCTTIPSTAAPSPTLWEPRVTRHRHDRYCMTSNPPSAWPSSWHTDDDQTRGFHSATLEVAPGRAQDSPRRSARSKIRQDDQQLHDTTHHTAIRSLELCGTIVNCLPLAYKRRGRSPGRGGMTESRILARFLSSPRYWHSASIKPQGPGGLTSSPATLVAPLCKHNGAM
jgi:hypothetical protein